MFKNLSKDDEDMLYCLLLFVVVGFIIVKICQYNSNKVEKYINMDQFEKVQPSAEGVDPDMQAESANLPTMKERNFPPSLTSEGEVLSQMSESLADYKLLDEAVTVQPMIQKINNQLSQPSPDAFSAMYAPINFESKLVGSSDEVDMDSVQGPPRKQVPESFSGSKGGKTLRIIMVYAPWCGWSKKALPDFNKLIRDYNGKTVNGTMVQVIKYDSEVDTKMVKKYEVEGFPTFIMEKITTKTTTEVINERSYEGLVSVIKKHA